MKYADPYVDGRATFSVRLRLLWARPNDELEARVGSGVLMSIPTGAELRDLIVAAYDVSTFPTADAYGRGPGGSSIPADKVVNGYKMGRLLDALATCDELLPPTYRKAIAERQAAFQRVIGRDQ